MKTLEHKIEDRVLDLLVFMADLGLDLEIPEIKFNLVGRVAGNCRVVGKSRKCILKFNLKFMDKHEEDFLKDTVPHEVAHYVVFTLYDRGEAKPHGEEWRMVMRAFGVEKPLRCHSYCNAEPTKGRPWIYRCKCREAHYLSNLIHSRIREGRRYHCNKCKGLLKFVGGGLIS